MKLIHCPEKNVCGAPKEVFTSTISLVQFYFYRFSTIYVRHWKKLITGLKWPITDQEREVNIKRNG
jgi:hypothetical protein